MATNLIWKCHLGSGVFVAGLFKYPSVLSPTLGKSNFPGPSMFVKCGNEALSEETQSAEGLI